MSQAAALRFLNEIKKKRTAAKVVAATASGAEIRRWARAHGYNFTRKDALAIGKKLNLGSRSTRGPVQCADSFWTWIGQIWARVCRNGGWDEGGGGGGGIRG